MVSEFEGAFLATEATILNINRRDSTKTVMMTKKVLLIPYTAYFQKHSPLTDEFNKQFMDLISAGLMKSWVNTFVDRARLKKSSRREHTKLRLNQLVGAIQLCVCALCLGFFVLLLEIISPRYRFLRTILDFITY